MEQSTPKIIVYTAIFGDYDTPREVEVVDPNVRYIMFTDNEHLTSSTWDIRYIYAGLDPREMSRHSKIAPYFLFFDDIKPDYSVWIDARFSPRCSNWLELCKQVDAVMCYKHEVRDCIYAEAKVCKEMGLDTDHNINNAITLLTNLGYPNNNGLQSTGFLIRNHKHENSQALFSAWLDAVMTLSIRDQLSFNYVCWLLNIKIQQPPKGVNVYDNPYISKGNKHLKPRTI